MTGILRRPTQALSVLLVALLAFTVVDIDPADAATRREKRIERRLHNRVRRAHGRRRLRFHRRLNRVARRHSLRMARRDRLYHNRRLVREVRNLRWRWLGENVGVAPDMGMRPTLKALHRAFLRSRYHRRNILRRKFRQMGVGIVRRAGKVWITVIFKG